MQIWMMFLSLLLAPPSSATPSEIEHASVRYRGLEALLAKFDAVAQNRNAIPIEPMSED